MPALPDASDVVKGAPAVGAGRDGTRRARFVASSTRKRRAMLEAAVAIAFALCLSAGIPAPPASAAAGQDGFAERLDEDRWLSAFEVPGVAVALVRDGQSTWSKGYGKADTARGVAVTPDTVFRVGSISKP